MNNELAPVKHDISIAREAKLTHDKAKLLFMLGASHNGDLFQDFQEELHYMDPSLQHEWIEELMSRGLVGYDSNGKLSATESGQKLNEAYTDSLISEDDQFLVTSR